MSIVSALFRVTRYALIHAYHLAMHELKHRENASQLIGVGLAGVCVGALVRRHLMPRWLFPVTSLFVTVQWLVQLQVLKLPT